MLMVVGLISLTFLSSITIFNEMNKSNRNVRTMQSIYEEENYLSLTLGNRETCIEALGGITYQGTLTEIVQDLNVQDRQGGVVIGTKKILESSANAPLRQDGLKVFKVQLLPQPLNTTSTNYFLVKFQITYKRAEVIGSDTIQTNGIPLIVTTDTNNRIKSCHGTISGNGGGFYTTYVQCGGLNSCPAGYITSPTQSPCRYKNLQTGDCTCPTGYVPHQFHDFMRKCYTGGGQRPGFYDDPSAPYPPQPGSGPGAVGNFFGGTQDCGIVEFECILK